MAKPNITLNQEKILHLLTNDRDAAFAKLLQASLNLSDSLLSISL